MSFFAKYSHWFFNLKTLFIFIAFAFSYNGFLPTTVLNTFNYLDRILLQASTYIDDVPKPVSQITLVHVPDVQYDAWIHDILSAEELLQLLRRIQSNDAEQHKSVIGIVLENPISLVPSKAELTLRDFKKQKTLSKNASVEVETLSNVRDDLIYALQDNSVVLGVPGGVPADAKSITFIPWRPHPFVENLPWWRVNENQENTRLGPVGLLSHYPIFSDKNNSLYKVMVTRNGEQVIKDYLTHFLWVDTLRNHSSATAENANPIVWHQKTGLMLMDRHIALSADGSILPLYGSHTRLSYTPKQMTLAAALKEESLGGWVLIGRDNSVVLKDMAQLLAAVGDNSYLHTPYWFPVFRIAAILLVSIIFLLSFRFYWPLQAFSLWLSMLAAFVVMQIAGHLFYSYWLPCSELVVLSIIAWLLMKLQVYRDEQNEVVMRRIDEASRMNAELLISKGELDKASYWIDTCRTSDLMLNTFYRLATTYEGRNDYLNALRIYRKIKGRRSGFKNVDEKIATLSGRSSRKAKESKKRLRETQPEIDANGLENTVVMNSGERTLHQKSYLGRYEVRRELGRGAMGTVFLGFDPKISRPVAIKTLNYNQFPEDQLPEFKSRFFKEAKTAGRLNHPNIVQVYDVGEQDDLAFIAMDYAEGKPLSDYIAVDHLLPILDVYRIVSLIADALQYAHHQQIIHRDIKPGNIIYNPDNEAVKITDFGIARLIDSTQTRTGEIVGSPLYMAPEQIKGHKVTPHADIFSLGVTYYELLTGNPPFQGENLANLTYEITHSKHLSVRRIREELPQSAVRITNKALQKQPENRFPSAGEMAVTIAKAMRRDFAAELKSRNTLINGQS